MDRILYIILGAFAASMLKCLASDIEKKGLLHSNTGRKKKKQRERDSELYEESTKKEIYEEAQKEDIKGRSKMTKDELIDALKHS